MRKIKRVASIIVSMMMVTISLSAMQVRAVSGDLSLEQTDEPIADTTGLAAILGSSSGNVYENYFMGLSVILPESFQFADDKTLAEETGNPEAYLTDGKFTVQSESDITGLMVAEAHDKGSSDNVNITITNLNGYKLSEKELADIIKEQTRSTYDDMGLITAEHEVREVEFAGEKHYEVWYTGELMGYNMYQRSLLMIKDGYAMCIAITCLSQETVDRIVGDIEAIE